MVIKHTLLSARACAALAFAAPALVVMLPTAAHAEFSVGFDIRVGYAPPPMPEYDQPPLPGPDYIWVPGHWAWSDWVDDYYWVEGYWEQPPEPGLLWTPAWWGWDDGAYRFHGGYWGREVGWYGGIDYGHGYRGHGWEGGRWEGRHLAYNRAAINVGGFRGGNVYYQRTIVYNNYGPHTSYSGGAGGVQARPTQWELRASQAPHIPPTAGQQQRVQQAASNPSNVAARVTPNWTPPAVHRVGNDGAPIPRAAALANGGATAGAPPQYQRPATGAPIGVGPGGGTGRAPYRPATGYGATPQPGSGTAGTTPRPTWQNQPAPGYNSTPRPAPTPGYGYTPPPPAQGFAPAPRPGIPPNAYHAPAPQPQPQPQFHPAPAPAPRAAAPAPAAQPAPAPKTHERERDHQ